MFSRIQYFDKSEKKLLMPNEDQNIEILNTTLTNQL